MESTKEWQLTNFVWRASISDFILACSSSYFFLSGLPTDWLTTCSDVSLAEIGDVVRLVGVFFRFELVSLLVVVLGAAGIAGSGNVSKEVRLGV